MEEILASIKRIIADDSAVAVGVAPARAARPLPAAKADQRKADAEAKTAKPRKDDPTPDPVLELTDPVTDPIPASSPPATPDPGLLSDGVASASRHALESLSAAVAPPAIPETSLEGLTRDLLRPMLKDWLDAHLPQIVEDMVAREIARISTKRG